MGFANLWKILNNKIIFFLIKLIKPYYFEEFLLKKILSENNIIIDVGANVGQKTDLFLSLKKNSRILLFEPYKKYFKILKNKYSNNKNIKLFNIGVGNLNKIMPFYFTKTREHQYAFSYKKANYLDKKENISIVTIDKFLTNINPHIIKIDVEGLEFEVLQGAYNTIKRSSPYCFLEVTNITYSKCYDFFKRLNYNIYIYEFFIFKDTKLGWTDSNVIKSNPYKYSFYDNKFFSYKTKKDYLLNIFLCPKNKKISFPIEKVIL